LNSARLVLLTSSGQRGDGQMFADIGFAAYLLKPVTQRDLTECLMLVLANTADSWHMQSQPMITRHALRAQRTQTRNRALLAEDNLVNQKVALRMLQKLGHSVDLVVDGRAAVAAWQKGNFDLILMDCQMPSMDGYEATRAIRKLEDGKRRIPIVALTAHAMKGAEEKCRAAGMDDYLTKPIDRAMLGACMDQHLLSPGTTGSMPMLTMQSSGTDTETVSVTDLKVREPDNSSLHLVDWEASLAFIDGDEAFACELAESFIGASDKALAVIATAISTGDHAALRDAAHTLKGASANLRASRVTAVTAKLEVAAILGQVGEMPVLADRLTREVARAIEYLKTKID
jgi:CheY-like chemotaxis protein